MRKTFDSKLRELKTQCNTLIVEGEKNFRLYEKEYTDLVTKEIGINSRSFISIPEMEGVCQKLPHETIFHPKSTEIKFRDFSFVRASGSDFYNLRIRNDSLTPFTVMRTKGKDTPNCKLDEIKQKSDIEKLTYEYNKQSKEHYKKFKNIFKRRNKECFYAISRRYKLGAKYEDYLNKPKEFEKKLDEKGVRYEITKTDNAEQFILEKTTISFTKDGDLVVTNNNYDFFEPKDYFEDYWSS